MSQIASFPINLHARPNAWLMATATHGITRKIETYRMHGLWCLHFYTYHANLRVDQEWYKISPGTITLFPPDIDLEYRYQEVSRHLFAHFSLAGGHATALAPVMQIGGDRFKSFYEAMTEAEGWFATQRQRAEIRLWDLLWSLCRPLPASDGVAEDHPAVASVKRAIESGLGRRLLISRLAAQSGVSHNHLIRLFRAASGMSIVEYLRRRRVEQAEHLLRHSTLPIKAIAAQVGIADLHLFNKTIRRELGRPPTVIRASADYAKPTG